MVHVHLYVHAYNVRMTEGENDLEIVQENSGKIGYQLILSLPSLLATHMRKEGSLVHSISNITSDISAVWAQSVQCVVADIDGSSTLKDATCTCITQ